MPMLVGPERLLEAGALLRLLAELGQPAGVMEHAPHAGWTDRHHAGIDHHVRQPPVALQRVFGMKIENGLLFPILQPKVTGNPAVVLVRFSVALAPVVKLSSHEAEISIGWFIEKLGIVAGKFYDWRQRYGKANEHNGRVPRDFWLQDWEKETILDFHSKYPLEGYRRLTYMMIDAGVVAVSPASVWRVLHNAGRLSKFGKKSKKGTGFEQPLRAHEHWHIDISYINICGTFYYLCAVLDGYSRFIVHWDLRESMKESEVEIILQQAREKFPGVKPRIISDNGPQFIAKDFKEFIRITGMTHVRTSPYYPQSNGKLER